MLNYLVSKPRGWIKEFLSVQMSGLTGHIGEAGYPFSVVEWGQEDFHNSDENPSWWVYEQTGYWVDGYIRCAIALNDEAAISNAARIIYNVIDNADEDGYLGPKLLKAPADEKHSKNGKIVCVRWPHVVFFRAMMALNEYNKDEKIVNAMVKHYLGSPFDYTQGRNAQNIEIMCWLYKKTGNSAMLKLAEDTYANYCGHSDTENMIQEMSSGRESHSHGVSYSEWVKLGAILYECTNNAEYLQSSLNGLEKLEKYSVLPDGCPSSQEQIDGNDPMAMHETCVISDYTWSLEYLYSITGAAKYGDHIERCMFNAAPGAVLENFRGLQYFSGANQIICDYQSSHVPTTRSGQLMSYRPNPGTECCPGNVNRAMPNFALNMWAKKDAGYAAALLGPSELADGNVRITENTHYPFDDTFEFIVSTDRAFTLYIRYPEWYSGCKTTVDGAEIECGTENGFAVIHIEKDCRIILAFEAEIEKVYARRGVFFRRGPLVYSLGQKGERIIDEYEPRSSEQFPAFNMIPNEKWNYGIVKDAVPRFEPCPEADCFDLEKPLPHILVEGIEIKNLHFRHIYKRKEELVDIQIPKYRPGHYIATPEIMDASEAVTGEKKELTLSPYGACKLRISAFTEI